MSNGQIDAYIAALPEWQRENLTRFRKAVHRVAPSVEEGWKWDVPVFLVNGHLVCAMSAFAKHTKYNFFGGAALADRDQVFNARVGIEAITFDRSRRGRHRGHRCAGPPARRRLRGSGRATKEGSLSAMSRINDVGGMEGFPAVVQELDEPPFHADWEAHVFAMNRALIGRGIYNLDEFRDAVERMPPSQYLAASYYERWFHAINTLLVEKGVVTAAEMTDD